MAESYDDKIEAMLVTRQRMAEKKKEQRQKELTKQLGIAAVAIIILIIVIVLICKGCSGDKKTVQKNKEPRTTVEVTKVLDEESSTVQEEATTDAETAAEPEPQTSGTDLSGKTMYTTDVLNFRTEPNTDATLIVHIQKGEKVKVVSSEGDWCKVTYGNNTGYVKQEYLSENKPK